MATRSSPQYIAAGCGEAMMRLHIWRRSGPQLSIGPKEVEAQSMERANWMCGGIASVIGNLVQSKLGVATGVMAMWLLNQLTLVNAEASGIICAVLCVTYFKGLSKGSRSDPSSTMLILLSNMGGVAVDPMRDVDAPETGSGPVDAEG